MILFVYEKPVHAAFNTQISLPSILQMQPKEEKIAPNKLGVNYLSETYITPEIIWNTQPGAARHTQEMQHNKFA